MNIELTLDQLKIGKASQNDWGPILKLLEETDLTSWFTGNESYKNFYTVKEPELKKIICCFAIEHENNVGILKSFAIAKKIQGKGYGKLIANKSPEIAKELSIKKLYAASKEAPNFWIKTIFKEIKYGEIEDSYFLKYLNCFKDKVENYFEKTHYFLIQLD